MLTGHAHTRTINKESASFRNHLNIRFLEGVDTIISILPDGPTTRG